MLSAIGLGKFEKKNLGIEVVDVGKAQRDKRLGKLVCDDLKREKRVDQSAAAQSKALVDSK